MDFNFGEKAENLRKEVRQFVRDELGPEHLGRLMDEEHFDSVWETALETARKLAERGG